MGRRMRRMVAPAYPLWRAARDGAGQWIVVDWNGDQPFRSSRPLTRLRAIHLAAAAPQLESALRWLVEDFHRLELRPMHLRHRVRLNFAEVVLMEARPPLEEELRLLAELQLDLDLAA